MVSEVKVGDSYLCSLFPEALWTVSWLWLQLQEALGFPGDSVVKNPPSMREVRELRVQSLGWEDPLEEEMATHSSIHAWKIPWLEEPGGLQSLGSPRVNTTEGT